MGPRIETLDNAALLEKTQRTNMKNIQITAHKQLELDGKHEPEPLLMDNPGRFVLFPIKNPEVSHDDCHR